jgi:hypothetical protein
VKNRFQNSTFKCNLQRYSEAGGGVRVVAAVLSTYFFFFAPRVLRLTQMTRDGDSDVLKLLFDEAFLQFFNHME